MTRLNGDGQNQTSGKKLSVDIAGDFSNDGLNIAPFEPSIDDQVPASEREEQNQDFTQSDTKRNAQAAANSTAESLKSAAGQSTLGQETGKQLVNPAVDFPVDE